MKTVIGGDRLGSGSKSNLELRNYERSTHDLSSTWRSSMASGTLVPFMSEVALTDEWDIKLACEVLTLPTIGPLFGSYKVQLDVFSIPVRLYIKALHMNRIDIGNSMETVYLPKIRVFTENHADYVQTYEDNEQINPSCLLKYLGISGLGNITGTTNPAMRFFNAVPYLAYWDIYKNYYSNKQEEVGYAIHTTTTTASAIQAANLFTGGTFVADILGAGATYTGSTASNIRIEFTASSGEPDPEDIGIDIGGTVYAPGDLFNTVYWDDSLKTLFCEAYNETNVSNVNWHVNTGSPSLLGTGGTALTQFPLSNIDDMKDAILEWPFASGEFVITEASDPPYHYPMSGIGSGADKTRSCQYSQEALGIKTYQSDLFNNWIDTTWISDINTATSVDTSGGDFTIDALNLANKVYKLLNRIAISGGSFDDWLDAVYSHERAKGVDSPRYHGSLIKELAFQEVVSNSATTNQDLGTLAGRGQLTDKHKGGQINIKTDEPSYIMGIVSITPRVDYSQGNKWDMLLDTYDDFHKPALDGIAFQDLTIDQILWQDTDTASNNGNTTINSAGKQPAWINYMTDVDRVYGNFADRNKDMFMVLNRRYEASSANGSIQDMSTYVDPAKFNHIFASTELDSQNFWVQIRKDITVRRKMSAKQMPNL